MFSREKERKTNLWNSIKKSDKSLFGNEFNLIETNHMFDSNFRIWFIVESINSIQFLQNWNEKINFGEFKELVHLFESSTLCANDSWLYWCTKIEQFVLKTKRFGFIAQVFYANFVNYLNTSWYHRHQVINKHVPLDQSGIFLQFHIRRRVKDSATSSYVQ